MIQICNKYFLYFLFFTTLTSTAQIPSIFELSDINGNNGIRFIGAQAEDLFGFDAQSAGDFNNDGIDDIMVTAYRRTNASNTPDTGSVYIIYGTSDPFESDFNLAELTIDQGFEIQGEQPFQLMGNNLSSLGDINGDGIDDIIIGSERHITSVEISGKAYVIFGNENQTSLIFNVSEINGNNGFFINGIDRNGRFGGDVNSLGDINNDSINDFIISAYFSDVNNLDFAGVNYVIFGSDQGYGKSIDVSELNGMNGFKINGISENMWLGATTTKVGDFNNDNFDDFIISTNTSDDEAYLIFGAKKFDKSLDLSTLNGFNGVKFIASNNLSLSFNHSYAGDINNDGYDDAILVGNIVCLIFGRQSSSNSVIDIGMLDGTNGFYINNNSIFARDSSFAGDFNGDGINDIIISYLNIDLPGEPFTTGGVVIYGKKSKYEQTINIAELDSKSGFIIRNDPNIEDFNKTGNGISNAGDFNNDGLDDIMITSHVASLGLENGIGITYMIFGDDLIFKNGAEDL